jgi:DNA polymerase III delta prime subunit
VGAQALQLDPTQRSVESRDFEAGLRRKIVGQDEAVQAVVDLYQVFRAGLNSPGRPVGNLLFLGPTGAGKTRVVEATAEVLFGDPRAVIKVDCAEFQHSHEIAKLLGSPPGYLGHRETHPLITQEAPAQYHTEKLKISFLLFDEIQKASDALWQLLLGILDKATLTLGDNRRVDLSQTMIFMTSNLGGVEITELMTGGLGFAPLQRAETKAGLDEKVEKTASEAAKRKFAPEFMNRIDKTVVFHPLRSAQLEQILEIELGLVLHRVLDTAKGRFLEGRFAAGTGIRRERLHVGQRILDVQDQLIAAGEELLYRATHDNLTGMLNRGAIMDRLRRERSRQAREGGTFGIVLVDLDHFKYVNDTCGHLAGDDVLRQAAHDGVRAAVGFGGALRRRGIPDRGAFIGRDGHDGTGGKNPARD